MKENGFLFPPAQNQMKLLLTQISYLLSFFLDLALGRINVAPNVTQTLTWFACLSVHLLHRSKEKIHSEIKLIVY